MDNFSTNNLIFQDNNINIISIETEQKNGVTVRKIFVKSVNPIPPESCLKCGCHGLFEKKDYYNRKITDNKLYNENVIVYYKQLRYKCKACKGTSNEVLSFVDKSSRISNRLKESVINEIKREHTFYDVANSNNISPTTVQSIFEKKVNVKRLEFGEVLCFDEFRGPAEEGKFPFIIVDPYKSEIVDIVLSKSHNYLANYFSKIPLAEREKVKYIVTDLTFNYLSIINIYFPNAKHVADRFHWIRIITDALQKLRISTMKFHLKCAEIEGANSCNNKKYLSSAIKRTNHYKMYYTLKHNYKLLTYNSYDNEYPELLEGTGKLYNENTIITKREILEYMINNDEDLSEAYDLLQELYKIVYNSSFKSIGKELNHWIKEVDSSDKKILPLKEAIKTIKVWKTQIINSFIIDENLWGVMSNACCEAKNNTVKTIVKSGYGYKNPALLRKLILSSDRERAKLKNQNIEKKFNNFINKNM